MPPLLTCTCLVCGCPHAATRPSQQGPQSYALPCVPSIPSHCPLPYQAEGAPMRPSQQGIVRRMADIHMEAINVLDRMQRGELLTPPAGL